MNGLTIALLLHIYRASQWKRKKERKKEKEKERKKEKRERKKDTHRNKNQVVQENDKYSSVNG